VLHISRFEELSFRQQDNQAFLEFCLKENKPKFLKLAGKDVSKTINNAIESYNSDLLVMVNSRHSFLENLLYTSTIDKIGLNVKIPFLVLQNLPRT
jgi:nucleotide-binding universal stress UspA family protein